MMIRRVPVLDKAIGLERPYTSPGFPARRLTVVSSSSVPQQTSVELVSYFSSPWRWKSPIEGDVKRHFSPSAGRGRISRTSSPCGLPVRLDRLSRRSVSPSCSQSDGFMTRSVVDAIRLLKLASKAGRQSANHGPIGDSRPIAFLGYPEGHRVETETWCRGTGRPTFPLDTFFRTRALQEPTGHYGA
jgi:hypothetical protein